MTNEMREELATRIETNSLGWLPIVGGVINVTFTPAEAALLVAALRALGVAALPSSPAPTRAPHNSGEREPSVMPASGAGEAIFAECAVIALDHVGQGPAGTDLEDRCRRIGYDDACREIAEAIRLRASNRKTMDAIAEGKKT